MNIRKSLTIGAATLAGIATLGVGALFAAEKTNIIPPNPMSGIVNAIATTFNLNASDVQKVVDEQQQAMQKDMNAKRIEMEKTRLDQAVEDGKLTQAQEDLIIVKQTEMKASMKALRDKTQAEREAAIKANTEALKTWATANGIPEAYIPMCGFGEGKHGGPDGQGLMKGQRGSGGEMGGKAHEGFGQRFGQRDATSTASVQ